MNVLSSSSSCPPELTLAVEQASCFSDVFETVRPLAYHTDCYVSVARCKCTSQLVAVKTYNKAQLSVGARQQVDVEICVHSNLQHSNIIQFLASFEDHRNVYLVVEYADEGDVRKHLQCLDEVTIRDFLVVPVLNALNALHNKGFSHRDLKPENVLVHQRKAKLADFGLSMLTHLAEDACLGDADTSTVSSMSSMRSISDSECSTSSASSACTPGGTPLYAAPEVLRAMFRNCGLQNAIGPKNDVWALGVMALEAMTGCHPFSPDHFHYENVLYSIAHCKKVNLPSNLSPEFKDWLEQALQRDPAERPSTAELLSHPWINKTYTEEECKGLQSKSSSHSSMHGLSAVEQQLDCWEY